MPRFGLLSLTLAGLCAPLVAQDKVPAFVDMRLNLEIASLDYQIRNGDVWSDEEFDTGLRAGISWTGSLGLKSWGGIVWGLGGTFGYFEDDLGGADLRYQTWTGDMFIGYGFAIFESLQIEAMPVVTVGRQYFKFGAGGNNDAESFWQYGARANLVYTFGNGFQVGATSNVLKADDTNGAPMQIVPGRFNVGIFVGARL